MSPSGISLRPGMIDESASAAAGRALAFDEVAGSIMSVQLAGLEPRTVARTVAALERSAKLAQRASGMTGSQAPKLRDRAAKARAADAGGGGGFNVPWDKLAWANRLHGETLHAYRKLLEDEDKILKSGKGLQEIYNRKRGLGAGRSLGYRAATRSWIRMQRRYYGTGGVRQQRLELVRFLQKTDYKEQLKNLGLNGWKAYKAKPPKPPKGGLFGAFKSKAGAAFSAVGKTVGRGASAVGNTALAKSVAAQLGKHADSLIRIGARSAGSAIAVGTSILKGESLRSTMERVVAAIGTEVVVIGVQAAGGAVCAVVAVGTGGPGALACPAIVGVSAAVAGIVVNTKANDVIDDREKERQHEKKRPPRPRGSGRQVVPAGGGL